METSCNKKWELYDRLIEGIPAGLTVREVFAGRSRTMVRSEAGCGIAMASKQTSYPSSAPQDCVGSSLRDVAALVRSWNFKDASLGLAAMNAWYNTKPHVESAKARISEKYGLFRESGGRPFPEGSAYTQSEDAFLCYQDLVRGKKVAVIGHFAYLEKRYAGICDLSILERDPHKGDYPDTACEYILEDQDYVFITGSTMINKTLPRLLQLCARARIILCGPSTVMSDILFDCGADDLAGFMVEDVDACRSYIGQDSRTLFESGKMVRLVREECCR